MKKIFVLLLFIVVLISYGQLLRMYVWQDDNGLFFKLAHISEKAGYLAPGPFGSGAYKYIATPYILIYKTFGYNTVPYFILAMICYFITTVVIYKVASEILGEKAGRVSSLLWAAGYIASDGFIRLFNTVITSLSVSLISLLVLFYWRFMKEKQYKWYFLSVLFYFLSVELAYGRTHYLIAVVITFELIFMLKKPFLQSLTKSLIRLLPFTFIFYEYFIKNADARSGNIGKFLFALLHGQYHQIYGFLSSVSNVVIPDWFTLHISHFLTFVLFIFITFTIFQKHSKRHYIIPIIFLLFFIWFFISKSIFSVPVLNLDDAHLFIAFLGGVITILSVLSYFAINNKFKNLYLFFLFWFFVNIAAYSAYNPTVSYETVNRYLAHSFFALVLIGGTIYQANKRNKIIFVLLIFLGLGNVINSVIYQNNIVENRSIPPRNFYKELMTYVPTVEKGDIFYFDVNENATAYFSDAFSVASMPETTAIAWRYGIDRYDLSMFTDFSKFSKYVSSNNLNTKKIHSFWYNKDGLVDTSNELRTLISQHNIKAQLGFKQNNDILTPQKPISSVLPIHISLRINAKPEYTSKPNMNILNQDFANQAFKYLSFKNWVLNNAKYFATSEWQDRIINNIHDDNTDTVWQPDRILWHDKKQSFTIDLGNVIEIDRFVWINGFGNNTPTKYSIETSLDNKSWDVRKEVDMVVRIDSPSPEVIKFNPVKARFIRMRIVASLNDDAPGISEAWVVPYSQSNLDIMAAENFLKRPFDSIGSLEDFNALLNASNYKGDIEISWSKDNDDAFHTEINSKMNILYDGVDHYYEITIPAGGLVLQKIKLSDFVIPGNVIIKSLQVYY